MDAYDPLSYENLARSVVSALLNNAAEPLPPAEAFDGCGVYAIYYTGDLSYYGNVSSTGCEIPIYVGKAIPTGAGRKDMKRPRWDIVHPGRAWAGRLRAAETAAQIIEFVENAVT